MTTTPTQHLESIGHLACTLRVPVARVRRAVDDLGFQPALTINGIAHFNEQQCEQIAAHLDKLRVK